MGFGGGKVGDRRPAVQRPPRHRGGRVGRHHAVGDPPPEAVGLTVMLIAAAAAVGVRYGDDEGPLRVRHVPGPAHPLWAWQPE